MALVKIRQRTVRNQMASRYEQRHKVDTFAIGDLDSLRVPSVDRTSTDHRRIFCQVAYKPRRDRHQLYSEFGLLDLYYPTKNWSGFLLELDQPSLSLFHWHGKANNRSLFMRLQVLPLLDLWLAANAKAYVLTVAANAKKKDVHILGILHGLDLVYYVHTVNSAVKVQQPIPHIK